MIKQFALTICAATLMLSSCQKASVLTSDADEITAGLSSEQGSMQFHSDATNFSVEYAPEWVTAEMLDSTLVYYVAENDTKDVRTDSLVVTCGGMSLCIPVTQIYKVTKLNVEKQELTFPTDGGTEVLNVETDGMVVKVQAPKFIQAAYADGKLTITAQKNDGSSLSDTLRLTSGDLTANITVGVEGLFCGTCMGKKKITCPQCQGDGIYERSDGYYGCAKCGGDNYGPLETHSQIVVSQGRGEITCPTCHGTGK